MKTKVMLVFALLLLAAGSFVTESDAFTAGGGVLYRFEFLFFIKLGHYLCFGFHLMSIRLLTNFSKSCLYMKFMTVDQYTSCKASQTISSISAPAGREGLVRSRQRTLQEGIHANG